MSFVNVSKDMESARHQFRHSLRQRLTTRCFLLPGSIQYISWWSMSQQDLCVVWYRFADNYARHC